MRSRKPKKAQSCILLVICMITFVCIGCSTRQLLSHEKCKSVADELFAWPDSGYKLKSRCVLTLVVSKWESGRHQVIQYVKKDNGALEGRIFSFFFYNDAFGLDSVTKENFSPLLTESPAQFLTSIKSQLDSVEPQESVEKGLPHPNDEIILMADGTSYFVSLSGMRKCGRCIQYNNPKEYLSYYKSIGIDATQYANFIDLIQQLIHPVPQDRISFD